MKKLLKEYWKLFLIISLFYLFIILSSIIKVNYDITTPATIAKVSDEIQIEGAGRCNINTVSVYSYSKVSFLNFLIAKINQNADVSRTSEYEVTDLNEIYRGGVIQKEVSFYNAIIAGYKMAGYDNIINENSFKGYIIHTLATYAPPELKIGDIIIGFEGVSLKLDYDTGENEFEKATDNLDFDANYKYQFEILRDHKPQTIYVTARASYLEDSVQKAAFGVYTYPYVIPLNYKVAGVPKYEIPTSNAYNSIGPSGGLMQALYVYECLTNNQDIKNLKIVGTGTVDVAGNAGLIGGIYQKVIAANLAKADLFFVPITSKDPQVYEKEINYLEAKASYDNLKNPHIKLVCVSSLKDIIDYLENNGGKNA